jgi:undecaprenyl-diphosphatase
LDPTLDAISDARWRGWLARLVEREYERLAGFGLVLGFGFVCGIVAAYAFVWLAWQVIGQDIGSVDHSVLGAMQDVRSPAFDGVARAASFMGNEALYILGVLLVGLFARQRRWAAAALLVLVALGAQLASNLLKELFQRARPEPLAEVGLLSYAFPSGHAMVATAFYGFLIYLAWHTLRSRWRGAMIVGLTALVLAIGASRVYLGVHHVTDVVAGFVAGFVWLDAVLIAAHILKLKR